MAISMDGVTPARQKLLTDAPCRHSIARMRGVPIEGRAVQPSDKDLPPIQHPQESQAPQPNHRRRTAKLTKADLAVAAQFLRSIGAEVATIDLGPGKLRIVTTAGQKMALDVDDAELDRELQEYRANHAEDRD